MAELAERAEENPATPSGERADATTTAATSSPEPAKRASHAATVIATIPRPLRVGSFAVVALAALVGILVMFTLQVSGRVTLVVHATQIEIVPSIDSTISFARLPAKQLHVEALSSISIDGAVVPKVDAVRMPPDPLTETAAVTALQPLPLHAGSRLLIAAEPDGRLRLSFVDSSPRAVAVAHSGPLQIRSREEDETGHSYMRTAQTLVTLKTGDGPLDLYVTPGKDAACLVCDRIKVGAVAFLRNQFLTRDGVQMRQLHSSIVHGEIRLPGGSGSNHTLNYGDSLELVGLRGEIRRIALQNGSLVIELDGHVSELQTGSLGEETNIMPTWLQTFHTDAQLRLLFSALVGVLTLLAGAFKAGWLAP